jgi:HEAT repeat protein
MTHVLSARISGFVGAALACAALMSGGSARSDAAITTGGTAAIYGNVPPDQVEFLSDKTRIMNVARGGTPTAIWEALEHGERVECLECIPSIAPLLYDASPVTREIAAWWLRRRVFGVFGPGEVYEQTLGVLKSDPSPARRAAAAEAIGEFLLAPGADACADAIAGDSDPSVRAAAARALGRLNDDGKGALSRALADGDASVRLAALASAGRVNAFSDPEGLARLAGDPDAVVRRRAAEVIGARRATDAAGALIGLVENDADADVRGAACHALGLLHDPAARGALEKASGSDPNGLVRDLAQMALRRL